MNLTGKKVVWTVEDSEELQKFFEKPLGQRLLRKLDEEKPTFYPANAPQEQSFAQARDRAGFELAIATLLDLAYPVPDAPKDNITTKSSAYPALDDDAAWAAIEKQDNERA